MLSALAEYGGKSVNGTGTGRWIASLLPLIPRALYCEPFGGMAGIMLQRPRCKAEIYNDGLAAVGVRHGAAGAPCRSAVDQLPTGDAPTGGDVSMSTEIEWTDETWNPVTGCTKVSPGCANCYMFRSYKRNKAMGVPGYDKEIYKADIPITLLPERLRIPAGWRKPRRVFVCSMADLFHPDVPFEFIDRVISPMYGTQQHTYQVLTKRPDRLVEYQQHRIRLDGRPNWPYIWPPNLWVGVSVENQRWLDNRFYLLAAIETTVRFLSIEPLVGPVDLSSIEDMIRRLDWVIVGGESGPGHRVCRPAWVRTLRDQCQHYGIPYFFKQWGGRTPKAGGRHLDGRTWDQFPEGLGRR